jgi:hypothetical protein
VFDAFAIGGFMRGSILTLALILSCCGITFAQSTESPPTSKTAPQGTSTGPNINLTEIKNLPVNEFRPRITLQRALKIAENYTRQQRIDLSPYYLLEARLIQYGDEKTKQPRWLFRWVTPRPSTGGVEISVSMEGKPSRLISW